MQQAATAQLTLTLSRHFGQDVALESVLVLDAVSSFRNRLAAPLLVFIFGMFGTPHSVDKHNQKACRALVITSSFSGR